MSIWCGRVNWNAFDRAAFWTEETIWPCQSEDLFPYGKGQRCPFLNGPDDRAIKSDGPNSKYQQYPSYLAENASRLADEMPFSDNLEYRNQTAGPVRPTAAALDWRDAVDRLQGFWSRISVQTQERHRTLPTRSSMASSFKRFLKSSIYLLFPVRLNVTFAIKINRDKRNPGQSIRALLFLPVEIGV